MDLRIIIGVIVAITLRILWKFVDNCLVKYVAYIPRDLNYLRRRQFDYGEKGDSKTPLPSLLKEETLHLPGIYTAPTVDLSIIVPSYNEEERLPDTLDDIVKYCEKRTKREDKNALNGKTWTYEIIVIDDGSTDETSNMAVLRAKTLKANIKVIRLDENVGKGGAVRVGALHAGGAFILMVDADNATPIDDLDKLEKRAVEVTDRDYTHPAVIIGSRAHLKEGAVAKRSIARNILMYGFHVLVYIGGVGGIGDTQCGFKLFSRSAAAELFTKMHVERWAFDVEILYLAQQGKMTIEEVPVNFTEMPGSKIVPVWSWLEMGRDVLLIRYFYTFGHWKNELPN